MTLDGYSTTQAAAGELGITAHTLRAQIAKGRLVGVEVGGRWLIPNAEIIRYRAESLGRPGRKVTK